MKSNSYFIRLLACAVVALGLCSSCTAPYDATGSYSGQWSFVDNATKETINCPLTMTLEQNPSDNVTVRGTVHVDYECLTEISGWPVWLKAPAPADVEVSGLMSANGKLTLASGGCTTAACAFLLLDGKGESENKVMTVYAGKWGFAISVAFLGTIGGNGEFEVARDQ